MLTTCRVQAWRDVVLDCVLGLYLSVHGCELIFCNRISTIGAIAQQVTHLKVHTFDECTQDTRWLICSQFRVKCHEARSN